LTKIELFGFPFEETSLGGLESPNEVPDSGKGLIGFEGRELVRIELGDTLESV
jgi:hypothetical protein